MACCDTCACSGESFECLAVVAPERYRHFAEWCKGDVPSRRMLVRDLSRMGLAAIDARNPRPPAPPVAGADGPSLATMAANFGRALVTHAIAGFPTVDEDAFAARLAVCHGCEHYRRESKTCGICGCGELKLRWKEQRCPIGKW